MELFTAKSLRAPTIVATLAAVAVLGSVFAGDVLARDTGAFAYSGRVVHVVDGDTVDVALKSSKRVRVRVIGIDTPEVGTCYAAAATTRMIQLVSSKNVVLHGDATQATRDRYSRLLAYVDVGRRDAGATLVREGYARVYIYGGRPFLRTAAYQKAEEGARQARRGLWATCAASERRPAARRHPVARATRPIPTSASRRLRPTSIARTSRGRDSRSYRPIRTGSTAITTGSAARARAYTAPPAAAGAVDVGAGALTPALRTR